MRLFSSGAPQANHAGRFFGRDLSHHDHRVWRKLVLVRHGQMDYNVKHLLPGQLPGIPLNEEGQREARATAAALADLPLSAIIASPLERTLQTAAILGAGRGLAIRQDRDLLDTNYGPYSGKNWEELDKQGGPWARYMADPNYAPRGAESFAAVQRRAVRAAERWRHADGVDEWVALVTHADLVKMIVAQYLSIPLRSVPLINLDNAAASLLAFHPNPKERPTLLCFNWTSPALWLLAARQET
jgi:broad specificity phosphatase PhoE